MHAPSRPMHPSALLKHMLSDCGSLCFELSGALRHRDTMRLVQVLKPLRSSDSNIPLWSWKWLQL